MTRVQDNSIGVFEIATRNTANDLVDKNKANPTATLMAGVKLLEFHGEQDHADRIREALNTTISGQDLANRCHTEDLGGEASTTDFMAKFFENLSTGKNECFDSYKMSKETIGQKASKSK